MPQKTRIFDFDQTLTKRHTFGSHDIDWYKGIDGSIDQAEVYEKGKRYADGERKQDIEAYFSHDKENLSTIATCHNNPTFIAGFISRILGKELVLTTTALSETHPVVAINAYTVGPKEEGNPPLLICYIPSVREEFNAAKTLLDETGKNTQILFLRATLKTLGLVTDDDVIDFYDDAPNNFEHAKTLPRVNSRLISPKKPQFTIVDSFDWAESASDAMTTASDDSPADARVGDGAHRYGFFAGDRKEGGSGSAESSHEPAATVGM